MQRVQSLCVCPDKVSERIPGISRDWIPPLNTPRDKSPAYSNSPCHRQFLSIIPLKVLIFLSASCAVFRGRSSEISLADIVSSNFLDIFFEIFTWPSNCYWFLNWKMHIPDFYIRPDFSCFSWQVRQRTAQGTTMSRSGLIQPPQFRQLQYLPASIRVSTSSILSISCTFDLTWEMMVVSSNSAWARSDPSLIDWTSSWYSSLASSSKSLLISCQSSLFRLSRFCLIWACSSAVNRLLVFFSFFSIPSHYILFNSKVLVSGWTKTHIVRFVGFRSWDQCLANTWFL